jgi:putative ABC transport system permease protein
MRRAGDESGKRSPYGDQSWGCMVSTLESLRISLGALWANKLRACLTMSGIIIGAFLIFVLYSVGSGSAREGKKIITDLGPNAVVVVHGYFPVEMGFGDVSFSPSDMLQMMEDADAGLPLLGSEFKPEMAYKLQRELPEGCQATPMSIDVKRVEFGSRGRNVFAFATNENYPQVRDQKVVQGRYFNRRDEGRRVCVLGDYLSRELFGEIDPIGREVRVGGRRFRVLGVLESKGMTWVVNNDDFLLLPYWIGGYQGKGSADGFLISAPDQDSMRAAKKTTIEVLDGFVQEKTYTVVTQEELLVLSGDITRLFNVMNTIIIMVALLVAGVGIMNIMLVAVSERIREIGIRKAMGAKPSDICKQFLIEALLIGLVGGIIGVIAGLGFIKMIEALLNYPSYISLGSVLLALFFSLLVGVFFGVWPAMKAAAMDPVEALRHEL